MHVDAKSSIGSCTAMPNHNPVSSVRESVLKELNHLGPVTALKFLYEHLFVGYGPYLKVFRIDSKTSQITLQQSAQVFKRNKIHFIALDDSGSRIVLAGGRSFALIEIEDFLQGNEVVEKAINEWIVACEFLGNDYLLILTSHNEVLKVNVARGNSFVVEEKVHCNEKSLLYSGSIVTANDGRTLIAAGTVMNGVVIWELGTGKIIHNLTEHEGLIFGVKIDKSAQYIISCSDDRSVKLYDFPSGKLLATGWGHGSRIWSLEFIVASHDAARIFTTGEDCTARIWEYEPGHSSLKQSQIWDNCHLGKHVWSGDVSTDLAITATGGADGKVRIHDVSSNRLSVETLTPSRIQTDTGIIFEKAEVVKQFVDLPEVDIFVVLTSSGRLFSLDTAADKWSSIPSVLEDKDSMLRFLSGNSVIFASRYGTLLTLTFEKGSSEPILQSLHETKFDRPFKLINVFVASESSSLYVVMDSPNPDTPIFVHIFTKGSESPILRESLQLERLFSRTYAITAVYFDAVNKLLFIGSRYSNLAVYDLSSSTIQSYLVKKILPGDSITSISAVESLPGSCVTLLTIRDGLYLYIRFSKIEGKLTHDVILQNKVARVFIEGGFVRNSHLFLYGFRRDAFIVWNETLQVEISLEVCGGPHRQWKFTNNSIPNDRFSYINKANVVVRTFYNRFDLKHGLLVKGTHGREIRDVAISGTTEEDGSRLIATASEDATIKVGKLDASGEVSYQWTMNNHISGLQTVSFLSGDYIASSAANEELVIWRITRLSLGMIAVIEDSRIQAKEGNPDLRIMDFASIETESCFWIAAVYSNSEIKILCYDKHEKLFSQVSNITYSTFCILNVNFISNRGTILLVIGTTDGFITIWDVTDLFNGEANFDMPPPKIKQQLHQSGIKAIAIIDEGESWMMITGGDDNALVASRLNIGKDLTLLVESFVEGAASATITGISAAGEKRVLVSSVDQVIRLWSYSPELTCESATYTTVADTGCLDTSTLGNKNIAMVGGAGLSIWLWD